MKMRVRAVERTALIDGAVMLGLWIAAAALVNPLGDFPLNDDWSFGLSVQHLLDSGEFRPTGWTAMTLLSHTLWGALFASVTGFSFTALRVSTLVLGFLGVLASYVLARRLQQPRALALLLALSLAFNPVYHALSLTFMTDVPFAAWLTLAALCLCAHVQTRSGPALWLGTALCAVAILSRQLAIALPLAFALCLPLLHGLRVAVLWRALLPLAVSAAALLGFEHWLQETGRVPAMYAAAPLAAVLARLHQPLLFVQALWGTLCVAGVYLGLFALPLLPVLLMRLREIRGRVTLLALGLFALLSWTLWGQWMPLGGNILARGGVGPLTLKDTYVLGLDNVSALPLGFWQALTVAGLVSASIFTAAMIVAASAAGRRLATKAAQRHGDAPGLFLLVSALVYLGAVLLSAWFDRYLLAALPLLWAGTFALLPVADARATRRGTRAAVHGSAALLVLGFAVYSVAASHDYLGWNRTRWQLIHEITQQGVAAAELDGGFEFNGLLRYDPAYVAQPGKSWWWVQDDRYLVTFSLVPGYLPMRVALYEQWLPPRQGTVFVLQRPGS